MNVDTPSELQLDALREVANVGCGHAATALSQLVGGRKVQIEVPRVMMTAIPEMPLLMGGPDAKVVAAALRMEGELQGHLLLVLPERDARMLCSILVDGPTQGPFTEVQQSSLAEAANIVASACMNAMGGLTGLKLLPSPPKLSQAEVSQVVAEVFDKPRGPGLVLVLEARFQTALAPSVGGQLLLLPSPESLKVLLSRLGV